MSSLTKINQASFDKLVAEKQRFAIIFSAAWCKPCLSLKPTVEVLNAELAGNPVIYECDCDEESDLPGAMGVIAIPMMIFFNANLSMPEVDRHVGVISKEKIKASIAKIMA
jgi:thioredoxin 1